MAWYLSAMLFLYATFPYIIRLLRKESGAKKCICYIATAYLLQLAFAFLSQWIPFLNNAHWSCYILPVFRLGDFFVGCVLGSFFIQRGKERISNKTATVLEMLFISLAVLSMLIYEKQRNWFTYTLIFVPSSAGLIYILAQSEGIISHVLQNIAFQNLAVLTPFAFLIHRQVLHYIEDGYKIITDNSIHPIMLVFSAGIITIILSFMYMKYLYKKK